MQWQADRQHAHEPVDARARCSPRATSGTPTRARCSRSPRTSLKNDLRTFRRDPRPDAANDNTQWGADAIFKAQGLRRARSSTTTASPSPICSRHGRAAPEFNDKGWLAQASYAFKVPQLGPGPGYIELAGRYAEIDPSDLRGGDKQKEIGGAISWYYSKHPFKLQADYRQLENESANNNAGHHETTSSASRCSSSSSRVEGAGSRLPAPRTATKRKGRFVNAELTVPKQGVFVALLA